MGLAFEILYHPDVPRRDPPKIASDQKQKLKHAIERKLTSLPHEFGTPLRRTLKGYWKLRVGDYRVIYKIDDKTVIILRIGRRREVYEQ